MTAFSMRALFWAPRVLSIVFITFLSLFALDVLRQGYGFWNTLLALFMHLIPSFVLIVVLVLAWRWEWIGAALFAVAGLVYVVTLVPRPHPPPGMKLLWCATVAGPAFVIAALFLANWIKHGELHARP